MVTRLHFSYYRMVWFIGELSHPSPVRLDKPAIHFISIREPCTDGGENMKRIMNWLGLAALPVGLFIISMPLEAGRPLATDDIGIVSPGKSQLESGYLYNSNRDKTRDKDAAFTLSHGLTEKLDFELTVPSAMEPDNELEPAQLCFKYLLIKETESRPGAAFTFTFSPDDSSYLLNGICTKCLGPCTVHLNLVYQTSGVAGGKGTTTYSTALELPVIDRLTLIGEFVSASVWEDKNPMSWLIGGVWNISETTALDVGIGFGCTSNSPDHTITTGLTYNF